MTPRPDAGWPELPFGPAEQATVATLQRWTQIVGKIRLAATPWLNHSWHVTLYLTARGLGTSPIPHGDGVFEIDFDFTRHELDVWTSTGARASLALEPMSVAAFYARLLDKLRGLGIEVRIDTLPNEVPDPIPFPRDETHSSYDADYVHRLWRALLSIDQVFKHFRTAWLGKSSPVHFFWGSFDLAVTRFSGREAPPHPGGIPNLSDAVTREAYSHEVSSAGFWPGGGGTDYAAFYSYAYPTPEGFSEAPVTPDEASFSPALGEFLLPYEVVRSSGNPRSMLLGFLQTTFVAAARTGDWPLEELSCPLGRPGEPRRLG